MVERGRLMGLSRIALEFAFSLPFADFSPSTKAQIRNEQRWVCDDCGMDARLNGGFQIHHRVPQNLGGADSEENAVGLCSSCHRKWDRLAAQGIIYSRKGAMIHISQVPAGCFNNQNVRIKVLLDFPAPVLQLGRVVLP